MIGRGYKLSTVGAGAGRSPTGVCAADPHDGAREQHLVAEGQYGEPARQLHRRVRHVRRARKIASMPRWGGGREAHQRTAKQYIYI